MEIMKETTVIMNNTNDVLVLKVGGHQHYAEVATIEKHGHHDLHVNVNETFREFLLQAVGSPSNAQKSVIVTSDDCCDNRCITIKEADSGKFEAHLVARKQNHHGYGHWASSEAPITSTTNPALKVNDAKSTWFGWLRQLWAQK